MNALEQLDAQNVASIVNDAPVTFGFGGVDYLGTMGARDTTRMLMEGGFVNNQEYRLLVATAAFGENVPPVERETITVCVNAHGIPCHADDAVGNRITSRITAIGRAFGGYTFTIATAQRG